MALTYVKKDENLPILPELYSPATREPATGKWVKLRGFDGGKGDGRLKAG